MKRKILSRIKKTAMALVMSTLFATGMTIPVYADGFYDLGYQDEVGEAINMIPTVTSDWYGEYEITVDDIVYGLEIAPCWDNPEVWEVVAISHHVNDDDLTSWVGQLTTNDPSAYTTSVCTMHEDNSSDYGYGSLDDGSFNVIYHLMEDQNCDVALGKFTGDSTGNVYLSVSMSEHFEFPIVANGAPDSAFAPFDDNGAGMLYTKVSDSYGLTLSDWSDPQPQWITEWLNGKIDPIIINWQIQSNTSVDQRPTVTAEPAFYDWYYDDNSVG